MDDIGVTRHQYAGSSARCAYGTQHGESRTGPASSDGGRIEYAGNAGIVSAGCGLADLGTADHGTCITCRGSVDPNAIMKDSGLTRLRRLHTATRYRYTVGAGTGDNPHGVSDTGDVMPTGTSPSGLRRRPVFSNVGGRIGRFRERRKRNYTCPKSRAASRVASARAIDAASHRDDIALGSGLMRKSTDGQDAAGYELGGSRWGPMRIHMGTDALKVQIQISARRNWNLVVSRLARFEHHNTHFLRKFADIPSLGQKRREVCISVSGPLVATRNTWRVR